MITRAYVVDIKPGYVKVRIPIFNGIDKSAKGYIRDEDLYWATTDCIPGVETNYAPGDVVMVAFEDLDRGRPIVVGHLKSALLDKMNTIGPEINASTLNVSGRVILPKDIKIGNITYELLQSLETLGPDLAPISTSDIDALFN